MENNHSKTKNTLQKINRAKRLVCGRRHREAAPPRILSEIHLAAAREDSASPTARNTTRVGQQTKTTQLRAAEGTGTQHSDAARAQASEGAQHSAAEERRKTQHRGAQSRQAASGGAMRRGSSARAGRRCAAQAQAAEAVRRGAEIPPATARGRRGIGNDWGKTRFTGFVPICGPVSPKRKHESSSKINALEFDR